MPPVITLDLPLEVVLPVTHLREAIADLKVAV